MHIPHAYIIPFIDVNWNRYRHTANLTLPRCFEEGVRAYLDLEHSGILPLQYVDRGNMLITASHINPIAYT